MSSQQDEAIVLRTWPFQEADLLVAFFTRHRGKLKGIARHAMRSRKRFGGALEPMTHVLAHWVEKPKQELVRLDSFEIQWSPLREAMDYPRAAALALIAEVLDTALPDHAPDDDVFRLVVVVTERVKTGEIWLPVTYFLLWMTRLMGWMPELTVCSVCGASLRGQPLYYSVLRDGVTCAQHRGNGSSVFSAESAALAAKIFALPIAALMPEEFSRSRAVDLRRYVVSILERHMEERLVSAQMLARL